MRRALLAAVAVLVAGASSAAALDTAPAAKAGPTKHVVRRPVTSAGHVAKGYQAHIIGGANLIDCTDDAVSSVTVSKGVFSCDPASAYAVACWHAGAAGHVWCYQNPFGHRVVRYAAVAPTHASNPRQQNAPLGLVLDDGNECFIRDGGAWPSPTHHPHWIGYYSCTHSDFAVWGPRSMREVAGINESHATWTVYTGEVSGALKQHAIRKVIFVGTKKTGGTTPPTYTCVKSGNDNCGPYTDVGIPMSSQNTYVTNQYVGANTDTTGTLYSNNPRDWKVVTDARPYGYLGVQTFPSVQQLTNNWCPTSNTWCETGQDDTPLASLSSLVVHYSETGPTDANSIYEYAPDVWTDNYASDVMFWVDTHGRCDAGAFGGTLLGQATFGGQNWTVHRYGGAGAEIIFVLDGPGGTGTCAQQTSGDIDIKAGMNWLVANGFMTGPVVMGELNTGWEITSADNTTFTQNSYSITATPN